jgi:malate synthase
MDVPEGIEITGPMHERYDEILTPAALELVGRLHRELNGRRGDLLAARGRRMQALADGGTLDFLEETRAIREDDSWRVADPAPGLVDRRVEVTGPTDRKMTINALNSSAVLLLLMCVIVALQSTAVLGWMVPA